MILQHRSKSGLPVLVFMAHSRTESPQASAESRVIRSVGEAIEALADEDFMKDIRPGVSAKRGDDSFGLWFRGHARADYELTPSILRESHRQSGRYVDEVSMVRHFKAMNPEAAPASGSDFDWLVTMQHYLAPTRLLDWTENLLVALYFAVRDESLDGTCDAALWLLNARRLNYHTSATARTADVAFPQDPDVIARSLLVRSRERREWHDAFAREMRTNRVDRAEYRIDRIRQAIAVDKAGTDGSPPLRLHGNEVSDAVEMRRNLRAYKPGSARQAAVNLYDKSTYAKPVGIFSRLRMPVAVYADRSNSRIRSQAGVFTLHGGKHVHNPESYPANKTFATPVGLPISIMEVDAGLQRSRIAKWMSIPAANRGEIRKVLGLMGITEATLFPELDYQSRYLMERWTHVADENDE